jgi:hypothetical protein
MRQNTIVPIKSKRPFFSGAGCWGSLAVILASLVLYIAACALPTMVFNKQMWRGYEVLLSGWMGVFLGQFAWFANFFWWLGLVLTFLRRWFLTMAATALAFLIASDAFSFIGKTVPLDEAFVNTMIFKSYDIGFYFWLASIAAIGVGALGVWIGERVALKR